MMDDSTLKLLQSIDWGDVATRLLVHVRGKMKARGLVALPGGETAEDIAQIAIQRILDGRRKWNPDKHPNILNHLEWVADSLLSSKGLLGLKRPDIEFTDDEGQVLSDYPQPDDPAANNYAVDFATALKELVSGDSELEEVYTALLLGFSKPQKVADETGLKVTRVYELRRKMESRVKRAVESISEKEQRGTTDEQERAGEVLGTSD